jgi:hypothetical protein
MLQVKKVDIIDADCFCTLKVTADESLVLSGRVVKMDFGTVTSVEQKRVDVKIGEADVILTIMNFDSLPGGEYAVYLDTMTASRNALLVDDGPYFFTKGDK